MPAKRLLYALFLACAVAAPHVARADSATTQPFAGVTYVERREKSPRPLVMHIIRIDLATPGIRFLVTPHSGPLDTVKETTLHFLISQHAQIAVNAHYFEPWPPPADDSGAVDLVGLAASDGDVYSPFEDHPPKPYAILADAPGLNIDAANVATMVHRSPSDPSGRTVAEPVTLYNAVSGNAAILAGGQVASADGAWNNTLNPHTVIGLAPGRTLIVFTVDGRQAGVSEGMTTREVADLLSTDYGVTDALNLDGGGSTTLCMADPTPRVVNIPVGLNNVPGTERPVGCNLAVFASAQAPTGTPAAAPAGASPSEPHWLFAGGSLIALAIVGGVLIVVIRNRKKGRCAPSGKN